MGSTTRPNFCALVSSFPAEGALRCQGCKMSQGMSPRAGSQRPPMAPTCSSQQKSRMPMSQRLLPNKTPRCTYHCPLPCNLHSTAWTSQAAGDQHTDLRTLPDSRGVAPHTLGGAHIRVGRAVHFSHVDLGVLHAVVLVSQVVPCWLQPLAVSTPVRSTLSTTPRGCQALPLRHRLSSCCSSRMHTGPSMPLRPPRPSHPKRHKRKGASS